MPLLAAIAFAAAVSHATPAKPSDPAVDVCVKAAAATDHIAITDVDRDACTCATKQLRSRLSHDDFDLHQQMLQVIATGADKKAFDKRMSDIMLKRGMNQQMVDAFLARSKKAEDEAQGLCNASPLLGPSPLPRSGH
ncbi:MAG TPA: hypothetical protein VG867_07415 [Rhizomicrobium sp.]|nr:hypothetical protein [Rhizomicrobium sp.]